MTQSADSFLLSDVVAGTPIGPVRGQTSCSGAECTSSLAGAGISISLSLSDLTYTDADTDTDTEYQAVATRRGVSLAQGRGSSRIGGIPVERFGYGGWLDHSYFISESGTVSGAHPLQGARLEYSFSVGNAAGTNPAAGGGSWTGVMAGVDTGGEATKGNRIQGDAEIAIEDFDDPKAGVRFTGIHDLVTGDARPDMIWSEIPLTAGSFMTGSDGDSIAGRFYGPNHEEVGGVFDRNDVIGAFGAKR